MNASNVASRLSRRSALKLGAALATGIAAKRSFAGGLPGGRSADTTPSRGVQQMLEEVLQAEGKASNGVFSIDIDRKDIQNVTLHGVPISPDFLIHGDLDFQAVNDSRTQLQMNADLCLKASELDPFIRQLVTNDLVFQAEHQHIYDFQPLVWFVHFRALGDGETIAKAVKAALSVTSTPFPQKSPANPTTPLPAQKIGEILGAEPKIGGHGVVTYQLPRQEQIALGGVNINPFLNVATHVHFQPYGGGQKAAVCPDFGMIASEVNKVIAQQLQNGWDIGCLYNQESDEQPQLYWSHTFKTGDSIQLAHELRQALALMNLKFK